MSKLHSKPTLPKIGIDLNGGDIAPEILLEDLLQTKALMELSPHLVLFAPPPTIALFEPLVHRYSSSIKISLVMTKEIITMEDDPLTSVRMKKDSPIMSGLFCIKEGSLDAFVSIGNTGALLGGATLVLKKIKSIKRPGLLAILPTLKTPVVVIDVGANVSCKPDHLIQFAKMGIAYQKCLGVIKPKVALLNIGAEKEKGRIEMRETYKKLEQLNESPTSHSIFIGNIEGREVFTGLADVLVTDGFSGNIFIKTAEGTSAFILEKLNQTPIEAPQEIMRSLDYAEYPGALICGIEGVVIKCHGYSNAKAVFHGIQGAAELVKSKFLQKLKNQLKH